MFKAMLIGFFIVPLFYTPCVFSQENIQGDKGAVIIKNEVSSSTETQNITAPALVPSDAAKLRNVREKEEIKTEDSLMKELEKQRLLDEQKRADKLFGNTSQEAPVAVQTTVEQTASDRQWFFGNKSFASFGAGIVTYPGVDNINSTDIPAGFLSFGGYGYKGRLIFDLSVYYSRHYIRETHLNVDVRQGLHQPAVAMAVKISPLTGKMKPYVGVSGSMVYRKWFYVDRSGESLEDNEELKDIADKTWNQSFDAGLTIGADLALGERLGLNLDLRYHLNLYTENRKVVENSQNQILDGRDSIIFSGNLRYYF